MTFGAAAAHAIASERERVGRADAFVVITPEYNHSYPAALKQFIDLIKAEWQAKPASFVSYGGMSGGLRVVEHLRNVFTEMHTVTIRDIVSFHNPWARVRQRRAARSRPTERRRQGHARRARLVRHRAAHGSGRAPVRGVGLEAEPGPVATRRLGATMGP